jgi:SAM-dependent methyltransferase
MIMFNDHFSSHAATYAAFRPGYPPELAAWLASIAPGTDCALDVGCGSGQLALLLAQHFPHVLATDPSWQQISSAMPHPNIDYRVAPAEASGLPCGSIDLLTAAQAAHWFHLPAFFAESRRLLKPGGAVVLISYAGMEHRGPIEPIVDDFRLETLKDYWPPERAMVENGYRGIALPFTPIATPDFAIELSWPLAALIGYIDTWSAVRAMERRIGRGPLDAFVAELTAAWGDPMAHRTIRWPLTILAGRGA